MKISETIQTLKKDKEKRTRAITFTTMLYNFFWSIGKILFGIFMHSYVYLISGVYTLMIAFVKKIFISNHNTKKSINPASKSIIIGSLLTAIGFVFAIYMGRLFFISRDNEYGLIWSIAIATCSFVELGIAVFNLVNAKKKNDILLFSLRCCNVVSSVFAIVLTQVALLSATGAENISHFNAITGSIAGLISIILGSIVIIVSDRINKREKETAELENTRIQNNEKSEN